MYELAIIIAGLSPSSPVQPLPTDVHVVSRRVGRHINTVSHTRRESDIARRRALSNQRAWYRVASAQLAKVVCVLLRQNEEVNLNISRTLSRSRRREGAISCSQS